MQFLDWRETHLSHNFRETLVVARAGTSEKGGDELWLLRERPQYKGPCVENLAAILGVGV